MALWGSEPRPHSEPVTLAIRNRLDGDADEMLEVRFFRDDGLSYVVMWGVHEGHGGPEPVAPWAVDKEDGARLMATLAHPGDTFQMCLDELLLVKMVVGDQEQFITLDDEMLAAAESTLQVCDPADLTHHDVRRDEL